MAERFDVAARLSEGRPAVEHTQTYVWACHVRGYQHPDLTGHPAQVREWYESDDGLDLPALDADCAALRSALNGVAEAARTQRAQIAVLAAAWSGPAADSALGLLQGHCAAADAVTARMSAAAEGCGALRDNLWQLIDRKVATAVAVDDRTALQRAVWLAAAQTVTAGQGEQSAAGDLVDHQLKPYVDNDVRVDWLTVMRSVRASAAASYDRLIDELAAAPAASFRAPGEPPAIGRPFSAEPVAPESVPAQPPPAVDTVPAGSAETVPAALAPGPLPAAEPPPAAADGLDAVASAPAVPAPADWAPALGEPGDMPTGTGDLGGLGGLIGRIAEVIAGLLGSLTDGLGGPGPDGGLFSADAPVEQAAEQTGGQLDDPAGAPPDAELAGADTTDDADAGDDADATDAGDIEDTDAAPQTPDPGPQDADDAGEDPTTHEVTASAPGGAGPPAQPPPAVPPESGAAPSTPCEIAADQLPQAGR